MGWYKSRPNSSLKFYTETQINSPSVVTDHTSGYLHYAFILVASWKQLSTLYSVYQEERSIFWEVIVSVILSRNVYMNMCPIPNGFRDKSYLNVQPQNCWQQRDITCTYCFLYRYLLFKWELVQFIRNVRKFHRQYQCTLQLVWRHGVLFVWVRLDVPLCRR